MRLSAALADRDTFAGWGPQWNSIFYASSRCPILACAQWYTMKHWFHRRHDTALSLIVWSIAFDWPVWAHGEMWDSERGLTYIKRAPRSPSSLSSLVPLLLVTLSSTPVVRLSWAIYQLLPTTIPTAQLPQLVIDHWGRRVTKGNRELVQSKDFAAVGSREIIGVRARGYLLISWQHVPGRAHLPLIHIRK